MFRGGITEPAAQSDSDYWEHRQRAIQAIKEEWSEERGYSGPFDEDYAPLAIDLVTWTIWLRSNTDFFSGPDLDLHYPKADSPEFLGVLAQNALIYTGE